MKKLFIFVLISFILSACATSHSCDAYRKADMTKKSK